MLQGLVPEIVEDCDGDTCTELSSPAARDELKHVQHRVTRTSADRADKEPLERQSIWAEAGRRCEARLRSCTCLPPGVPG